MPRKGASIAVTGAGSGLGLAIADHLEAEGQHVLRLSRTATAGARVFDVTSEEDWEQLSHAGVSGLVHAAGVRERAPLRDTSIESFRRVLDVNLTGAFLALRWISRHPGLGTPKQETLFTSVMITSAVVTRLPEEQYAYNASKAGLDTLVRSAARELAPYGVRVNALAAGSFFTPMTAQGWKDEHHAERMRKEIPLGRPGDPKEIAALTSLLLGPDSSYMTGSIVTVDGGWSA